MSGDNLSPASRVSVVIPVRNDARMLRHALAALGRQTRRPDEIVVVDNASTDDSAALARAAGARVIAEPVVGIWPAAATGYDGATGDVIVRLDADSRPPAGWLERMEEHLADPGVTAVTGPGDFYDGNRLVRALGRRLYIGGYFWSMTIWLGHRPLFGSNFAIRRRAWARLAGSVHRDRADIHDDLDLSIHLEPDQHVVFDPALSVGISARPFATWSGLGRRLACAYRTLRMHAPERTRRRGQARRRSARQAERYSSSRSRAS